VSFSIFQAAENILTLRIWPSRSTRSFTNVLWWWSLRSHRPWYRDDGLVAYAFVLGDNLSADEKNQSSNL
jgi:hypothetical protein